MPKLTERGGGEGGKAKKVGETDKKKGEGM